MSAFLTFTPKAPENLICPLSMKLLSDYVILPTNGLRVDRETIETFLPKDNPNAPGICPFTRKDLSYATLITVDPDEEFGQILQSYVNSVRDFLIQLPLQKKGRVLTKQS